jgi:hypothetical protein
MTAVETEAAAAAIAARPRSLATALVAALAELTVIERGRKAKIETKGGGSYSYAYADIGDVVAETRPVLAANGIVALTPICGSEKGLACKVTLIHTSGETMVFDPLPFVASQDPQQAGSAITYFRRYALLSALGMATTDDDGAAAKAAAKPERLRMHPNKVASLRERCAALEASVSEVVRDASGGRTDNPEELFADEADAVKAALEKVTPADA